MSDHIAEDYTSVRNHSTELCLPLQLEDYCLQAELFTSPPKWHLAHTTWFFETFILKPFGDRYCPVDARYEVLFNSYYNAVGEQYPRHKRGLLSRPSLDEVLYYRRFVDNAMLDLLRDVGNQFHTDILKRCLLGLQHEQQHQELLLTDLKYSWHQNPILPSYNELDPEEESSPSTGESMSWLTFTGGDAWIGSDQSTLNSFAFDNELPRHQVVLAPFQLASRLVTNGEFQAFIDDGGYREPSYWLADGWQLLSERGWDRPLYWRDVEGQACEYTLYGLRPRHADIPVTHINGYEADAYANWAKARLPTEFEWEHAAQLSLPVDSQAKLHPKRTAQGEDSPELLQMFGECWQWTGSAYRPYPGFRRAEGAVGEYNGKFMSNQWVLRGSSCVTPADHSRATYRNFFYPQDAWQFTGIRLARDP